MNLPQGTTLKPHLYHGPNDMDHIRIFSLKNSNVKAMYDCTFYVENDLDVSIAQWLIVTAIWFLIIMVPILRICLSYAAKFW